MIFNFSLVKKIRKNKHLSTEDMANALGLKSASNYYRREKGIYNFKVSELPKLSKVLNVPIENFFTSSLRKSKNKIKN